MSKLELGTLLVTGFIWHALFLVAHLVVGLLSGGFGLIITIPLHLIYMFVRGGRYSQNRQNRLLEEQNRILREKSTSKTRKRKK